MKKLYFLTAASLLLLPTDGAYASLSNLLGGDKDGGKNKKPEVITTIKLPTDQSKGNTAGQNTNQVYTTPIPQGEPPRITVMEPEPEAKIAPTAASSSGNAPGTAPTVTNIDPEAFQKAMIAAVSSMGITPPPAPVKEEKTEPGEKSSGWVWKKMVNACYYLSNTTAEQAKFPQLTIKELQERYSQALAYTLHPNIHLLSTEDRQSLDGEGEITEKRRIDSHAGALAYLNKNPMDYKTEGDYAYDGHLHILDIQWGILRHDSLPGQKTYNPNATFISMTKKRTLVDFLRDYPTFKAFAKGKPYKNEDAETCVNYWADHEDGAARIELLVKRLPKPEPEPTKK